MLSDEERKAINQLKADTSFYDYELKNGNYIYELFKIEVYKKDIDVILNLIEKQSKEIEELKEKNEHITKETVDFVNTHYISKEKIKAKIEEKFLEAKGLYERGVQPQAQYTMKLLRDLEKSLLEKE